MIGTVFEVRVGSKKTVVKNVQGTRINIGVTPGRNGIDGTDGDDGDPGLSAYEIALDNGFEGDESDWLNSLKGEDGEDGQDGEDGTDGQDGEDGIDGIDGQDGQDGDDGLSAYEIAVDNGFVGSESSWLNSLKGVDGVDGDDGIDGIDGEPGKVSYQPEPPTSPIDGQLWLDSDGELPEYGFPLTGMVIPYAGSTAPTGYLLCDGAAVSRSAYAALFAVIGTSFGSGNGTTTFNVPDTRDRVLRGVSGTAALGSTGGSDKINLTSGQLPAHRHKIQVRSDDGYLPNGGTPHAVNNSRGTDGPATQGAWSDRSGGAPGSYVSSSFIESVGNADDVSVVQKYASVNHLIKT